MTGGWLAMRSSSTGRSRLVMVSPVRASLSPSTATICPAVAAASRVVVAAWSWSTRATRSALPRLAFQTSSPSASRPE